MHVGQHTKHLIPVPDLPVRLLALVIISASSSGPLNAEERYGWKLEWTSTTAGSYSEADDCASTLPSGACSQFSGAVGISGQSSGSFVLDQNGLIVSGSSEGRSNRFLETWATGECQVGEGEFETTENNYRSEQSTDLRGPSIGDTITIYERTNESGLKEVYFDATNNGVCHVFATETASGVVQSVVDAWACEPYDYTNVLADDTYDPCPSGAWGVAGWATGTALATDEDNLVFSGTRTEIAGYVPAGVFNTVTEIPYTNTITVTATKISLASIHGIELTQATQVYQPLEELKSQLEGNDGNPPIPLVAYKPLAIRVVLEQPTRTFNALVKAYWNGVPINPPVELTQSQNCAPPDKLASTFGSSRENLTPDCRSADFFVDEPQAGMNELRIVLSQGDTGPFTEETLSVRTNLVDTIAVGAVNVCAARAPLLLGGWECVQAPARQLERGVRLMREIFPTDFVVVEPTNHQIHLEVIDEADTPAPTWDGDQADCYDRNGVKIFNAHWSANRLIVDSWDSTASRIVSCEPGVWWDVAAHRIGRLHTATESLQEWIGGIEWFFYGLVNHNDLFCDASGTRCITGSVYGPDIPNSPSDPLGRGALGVAEDPWTAEFVRANVAHEIGHLFGRRHTNKAADVTTFYCGMARDSETDYPASYPNSGLYSGDPIPAGGPLKEETGFSVRTRSIRSVFHYRDIMSYCEPRWITPFTYMNIYDRLSPHQAAPQKTEEKAFPLAAPGPDGVQDFWLVSGLIADTTAHADAIFRVSTVGPVKPGVGTYRIDVRDDADNVLFTRAFTPNAAHFERNDDGASDSGLSWFTELIPVQASASKIVVLDDLGAELVNKVLTGAAPVIDFVFPSGGEQLDETYEVSWTASDSDTELEDLFFWVQYSPDDGERWITIAQDLPETALVIDFNLLPGSDGAVIRVLGSDGVNTGSATSGSFSVSRKSPTVEIALPKNSRSVAVGEPVFFEGYGHDLESGRLPDDVHEWFSSRDGLLETGNRFGTSELSEGTHTIDLLVTDGDGNMAADSVVLNVGVPTDTDGDGVDDASDNCPATPAGEPVDANGCSASQLDNDSDGVNDADDQCPRTPAGEAVDATGCSASQIDSDGDGVSDALDQCAGTPAGTAVGSNGCAVSQPSGGSSSGSGGGGVGFVGLLALGLVAARRKR